MALDTAVIESSFGLLEEHLDKFGELFYENLFTDYPGVKDLFKGITKKKQEKKLTESLRVIVKNINDTEKLTKFLNELGRRHVAYGTVEAHYPAVGATIIKTLSHFLDGHPEKEHILYNWGEAYGVIQTLMLQGANMPAAPTTAPTPAPAAAPVANGQAIDVHFKNDQVIINRPNGRSIIFNLGTQSENIVFHFD